MFKRKSVSKKTVERDFEWKSKDEIQTKANRGKQRQTKVIGLPGAGAWYRFNSPTSQSEHKT